MRSTPINKLTKIAIAFFLLFITGCSNAPNNRINVTIPTALKGNQEVEAYLHETAQTIDQFNHSMQVLAKLTNGKDIENTDSLSKTQLFILGKEGVKMMIATSKLEELSEQKNIIEAKLNNEEKAVFKITCKEINSNLGTIDFKSLGFSEEEASTFQEQMKEQQVHKEQKQAYSDSINALSNEPIQTKPEENRTLYENDSKPDNQESKKQIILFFAAFGATIIVFILAIVFTIKKIIRFIKNIR